MRISKFALVVACAGITLATVACGSSSNTTTAPSTTSSATTGSTATPAGTATTTVATPAATETTTVATTATTTVGTPAATETTTVATPATTTPTSTGGGSNAGQITVSGDINAAFTPDATAPVTCTQNPLTIVLQGTAGGHRGTVTITMLFAGGNVDVEYLPDGVGGARYVATHIPHDSGDSRGSVTFNADGSGKLDIRLQYVPGSAGSLSGSSVSVKGTWSC